MTTETNNPTNKPRLQTLYHEQIVPELMKKHGYRCPLRVPRLLKIVLNVGVGNSSKDKKLIPQAMDMLTRISGQKPVTTKARKSISGFSIREGFEIGCMVTLRGKRMMDFLDRLNTISLPRTRDFRGLPAKSFDGRGNYSFGIKEHIIFQEIKYEDVEKMIGLDVALVTNARSDDEARELLLALGLPIREKI